MPDPTWSTSTVALTQIAVVELIRDLHSLASGSHEERGNADRASRAALVLHAHAAARAEELLVDADVSETLTDLLADLLHYADREDIDIDLLLEQAREHHAAEVDGHG